MARQTTWSGTPLDLDTPRECRLYRFWGRDPHNRGIGEVLLYIGETGRAPADRMFEHLREKPWFADVTRWEVDPTVYWSKAEVLAAEEVAIKAEQPIYNWEHNGANPWRVWVEPAGPSATYRRDPAPSSNRDRRPVNRPGWFGPWVRRHRRPLAWVALWPVLTLGLAVWIIRTTDLHGWDPLGAGAVTSSLLLVALRSGGTRRRRRRR